MDRYNRILDDIRRKTDDEVICWKVVNADRYSDVLLNPHRVIRAFLAPYNIGGKTYNLLFVERKTDFHDDFDPLTEGFGYDLFILDDDGQIVVSLYEGVVDRDDLLRLSGLIDEHNDRAQNFFRAFDESGAA